MLSLSSSGEVLRALASARRIGVESYTLHGAVLYGVEAAARRGADVDVALEGRPYGDAKGRLAAENRRLAAELRAAGARVRLGHPLHAKAVVTDGTLYLDEKNWGKNDLILREDDRREAKAIPAIKHEALAKEAGLIDRAARGDGVIVESESFGTHNAVYSALKRCAQDGAAPRLLVSERDLRGNRAECRALERLAGAGVRVRVCRDSEKLAVAGGGAWLGSANATWAGKAADGTDWGLCTGDPTIVRAVRARLEAQWLDARPAREALPRFQKA